MVCRYLLNPDLPPPSDLGPLLGSGMPDAFRLRPNAVAKVLNKG